MLIIEYRISILIPILGNMSENKAMMGGGSETEGRRVEVKRGGVGASEFGVWSLGLVCESGPKPHFSNDSSSKVPVDAGAAARSNTHSGQ
jgi:hypothetical protein